MIEAYRVSWLAQYLKALIESDLRLSNIWLEGEVSNLTRSSAGHIIERTVMAGAPVTPGRGGRPPAPEQ